jgi:type I restriction-modification system DNA methylase subunit
LTYNGGLFNPQENDFVENNKLLDLYLVPVLYYMTYYEDKSGTILLISYRDLSVRHLGSLYEGLLEHRLFVTEEDTEVRFADKEIKFIPQSEGGKIIQGKYIPKGFVYFGNDKGERKATGAFYTPECIVDDIVSNTVGQKLSDLQNGFLQENKENISTLNTAIGEHDKNPLRELLKTRMYEFMRNEILKLSALDPAMGSGHFLVNATNRITNQLVEFLNQFDIISDDDTSPRLWRRRVVENCIYGVDINPLAVELAKLSLWILSMSKDQPLSFLDHHLKCGNSLIGAQLSEVGSYPRIKGKKSYPESSLFENNEKFKNTVKSVISRYQQIETQDSSTLDYIGEKKQWLDEINIALKPYRSICDLHISIFFQNDIPQDEYASIISSFSGDFCLQKTNYFHWELEFPEVMIKQGKFGVIIGNPPWGADNSNLEKEYFKIKYTTTQSDKGGLNGSLNSFSIFLEQSLRLLRKDSHCFGFILPLSFATTAAMQKIQNACLNFTSTFEILNFSERPGKIFPGVEQAVTICMLKRIHNNSDSDGFYSTGLIKFKQQSLPLLLKSLKPQKIPFEHIVLGKLPKISDEIELSVLNKVKSHKNLITNYLDFTDNTSKNGRIYFKTAGGRYYKPFTLFFNGIKVDEEPHISTTQGVVTVKDLSLHRPICAVLNSSLFFWVYQVYSDCWHLINSDFQMFNIDLHRFEADDLNMLSEYSEELMENFINHSKIKINFKGNRKIEYIELYAREGQHILDKIDRVLSKYYNFTERELEKIITYRNDVIL